MKLVLASSSVRRKEILNFFSLPFVQMAPEVDEEAFPFKGDPVAYVKNLAEIKANVIADQWQDAVVIAADTTVYAAPHIYAKPQDHEEAFRFLSELSGKSHEVWTAVCIIHGKKKYLEAELTRVTFHELTGNQIKAYIEHIHPLDKAGGYAIQKLGSLIVKKIEGCFYNVMGLPLNTLQNGLHHVGIDLWQYLKK